MSETMGKDLGQPDGLMELAVRALVIQGAFGEANATRVLDCLQRREQARSQAASGRMVVQADGEPVPSAPAVAAEATVVTGAGAGERPVRALILSARSRLAAVTRLLMQADAD